jgi:hypothetical protein
MTKPPDEEDAPVHHTGAFFFLVTIAPIIALHWRDSSKVTVLMQ